MALKFELYHIEPFISPSFFLCLSLCLCFPFFCGLKERERNLLVGENRDVGELSVSFRKGGKETLFFSLSLSSLCVSLSLSLSLSLFVHVCVCVCVRVCASLFISLFFCSTSPSFFFLEIKLVNLWIA